MELSEMLKKRAGLIKKAEELLINAEVEKRELTTGESETFDSYMDAVDGLSEAVGSLGEDYQMIRADRRDSRERQVAMLRMDGKRMIGPMVDQDSEPWSGGDTFPSIRSDDGREVRGYRHGENMCTDGRIRNSDFGDAIVEMVTGRRMLRPEQRSMMVDQDTKGGYVLSGSGSARLFDLARAKSVMSAAGAVTYAIQRREETFAKITADPAFTWAPELSSIALDDSMTFGALKLQARKCATRIKVSDEAMKFANIGNLITDAAAQALAVELDRAALIGSGAGAEPVGIVNTTGVQTAAAAGNAMSIDGMIDVYAALQDYNVEPNAFIVSPTVGKYLLKLKNGAGDYQPLPGAVGQISKHTTTAMSDTVMVMGRFSDFILAPFGNVAVDVVKDVAGGEGAWLIQILTYFDCGAVWPSHFYALTGINS